MSSGKAIGCVLTLLFVFGSWYVPYSISQTRIPPRAETLDTPGLLQYSTELRDRWTSGLTPFYYDLRNSTNPAQSAVNKNKNLFLAYITSDGFPLYYRLHNLNAARTIGTNHVWPPPHGNSPHNIDGSGTPFNELAIWDGGKVRDTHVALAGKVLNGDASTSVSFHATHVAGTIVGRNDDPTKSGMSYEGNLTYYNQGQNLAELAAATATGLLLSNHSYGISVGWEFLPQAGDTIDWYWFGDTTVDAFEDYRFGFYIDHSAIIDSILYGAQYSTMVVSAGNDRGDDGPNPGEYHYFMDPVTKTWTTSTVPRQRPDGEGDGYDTLNPYACAKNVITVGSIGDLPSGWMGPGDVMPEFYSSFGPTDDGRIKPDIMANGDEVWSAWSYTDTSYINSSGTSMAAPGITGSINLLLRYWQQTHGLRWPPLASTMKAIVIHTADEGGMHPGPDYQAGWGLMNTLHACDVIAADAADPFRVIEDYLIEGTVREYFFQVSNPGDYVRITCVWTDPAAVPESPALNPLAHKLVVDMDTRVWYMNKNEPPFLPWILNPQNPDEPAQRGDNAVDNVEVIDIDAASGGWYRVTVQAKEGTVGPREPAFSLCSTHILQVDPPVGLDGRPPALATTGLRVYPNPFNPMVSIRYRVNESGPVKLQIFDVSGRHVRTLVSSFRSSGVYQTRWDGNGASGPAASGIYFVRFQTLNGNLNQKIVLTR